MGLLFKVGMFSFIRENVIVVQKTKKFKDVYISNNNNLTFSHFELLFLKFEIKTGLPQRFLNSMIFLGFSDNFQIPGFLINFFGKFLATYEKNNF